MTERRYSDEEVAAIFAQATEGPQTPLPQSSRDEGLTLADLQEIGREVGIAPDAVARAARAVSLRPQAASQTFLALPIGVERTLTLNRSLTDAEWEQLVGELRTTFRARGVASSQGSLRQWTNGNLQALLEPTATGDRLRLSTLNGYARTLMTGGIAMIGISAAVAIAAAVSGGIGHEISRLVLLSLIGFGMFANGALRLPSWARLRGRQMDAISAGLAHPASPPDPALPPLPRD